MHRPFPGLFEIRRFTVDETSRSQVGHVHWSVIPSSDFNRFLHVHIRYLAHSLFSGIVDCVLAGWQIGLSLFRKIVGLLHSQLVFKFVFFKLARQLLPFIIILAWLFYLLLWFISKLFVNLKLVKKFRSFVPVVSETFSAKNRWSDWIFYWSSCVVSDVKSGLLLKRLTDVGFTSFWKLKLWWDSGFFVLI